MNNNRLYAGLMDLVENSDKKEFYYDDHMLDGVTYRIFNYRLVGFDTFTNNPYAKYARGIMFKLNEAYAELVCLPMNKFFNYAEGVVEHDSSDVMVESIYEKLDGSLISSYIHNGEVYLKSKGSLSSNQAQVAMVYIHKPENAEMLSFLELATQNGFTVNMEWTSPNNRIVVGYEKDELRVLNIRGLYTHELRTLTDTNVLPDKCRARNCAERVEELSEGKTLTQLVNEMYKEETGEGYIINLYNHSSNTTYQVKIKNFKYCNLHKIKDSINTPTALCELVIRGQTDDLVEAFTEDKLALQLIKDMEDLIIPQFNSFVVDHQTFYILNKKLQRKDFAILARETEGIELPLAMNEWLGYETSYEDFAVKNMERLFGITNKEKQ